MSWFRRHRVVICALVVSLVAVVVLAAYTAQGQAATPAILIGAGDIAGCQSMGDEATAALLDHETGTIFAAGDVVYDRGTAEEFANCYEPSWGRFRDRTRPAVGNHEYRTPDAAPYYRYFGAAAGRSDEGFYSYELGSWHVVVLNSNCSQVPCRAGSAQEQWLRRDLAAHPSACTVAYWHHPRFSSGQHGSFVSMQPLWDVLYEAGVEVALVGHDHDYERFAPQDAAGRLDPVFGIRQFVVGTGGKNHYPIGAPLANSEVQNDDTFGVLRLSLYPDRYEWRFIPEAGKTFTDTGGETCHAVPGNVTPPATTLPERPEQADAQSLQTIFAEDFEHDDLARWSDVQGVKVERESQTSQNHAAHARSTGIPSFARYRLSQSYGDLSYGLRFKVVEQGQAPLYLLRFRTPDNASLLGVYISASGKLAFRNDHTDVTTSSTHEVAPGVWHDLQVYVQFDQDASRVEVMLDGVPLDELAQTTRFGDDTLGIIQFGDNAADRTFDVWFDDIVLQTRASDR